MPSREEALLELEARGALSPQQQEAVDELRLRGALMSKEEHEVRTGTNVPDYDEDSGGFLPASFRRFTGAAMDPLGVKDEIVGAGQFARKFITSGGDTAVAGDAYAKARDRERAKQKIAAEDYGILPDLAGAATGGVLAAPIVAAAKPLAARVARTMGLGAGFGAAAGAGRGEGGVTERAVGALQGGAIGAVAAPALSHVVLPAIARTGAGVAAAARYGNNMVRSYRNPEAHAIQNTADRMVAGGVEPAALRTRALSDAEGHPLLSTQLAARNFTEEELADIVGRARAGETHAAIAADHGIAPSTVSRYAARYDEAHPTQLNMMDMAKETVGEGNAMPLMRFGRAAMSLSDDQGVATASDRLLTRQEGQAGRVTGSLQRSVGGDDFETALTTGRTNLADEAGVNYRAFHAEPDLATRELDDLMADPLFAQASKQAQQQARVAAIRQNQEITARNVEARRNGQPEEPLEAVPYESRNDPDVVQLKTRVQETQDALRDARRRREDATDATEKRAIREEIRGHEDDITQYQREIDELVNTPPEVLSTRMLDNIQRQLRIAAEGKVANPTAARHADDLRQVFLDRIEQHYPSFRDIRRHYATGMGEFGEDGALIAGRELTTRLGGKTSDALRDFGNYTPAQQDLYRLGFARKMMDMAADPQVGGAVANKFNTPAVREIIEQLYPEGTPHWQRGQRLLRDLRIEKRTTDTKNFVMSGSQTAEKASDMSRMMQGAQAAADVAMGRWGSLVQNATTRLTTQLGAQGAGHAITMLTETNPAHLLPLLNRLTAAARNTQARQAQVTALRQMRGRGFERLAAPTAIVAGQQSAIAPKRP